jgi:hypothetical protein
MKSINLFLFFLLVITSLVSACTSDSQRAEKIEPAKLEEIEGTKLKRVILTEKAAQRIDIQIAEVRGTSVPYAAVIYDTEGNTWVYTNPESLTFVRQQIEVDHIEGDTAVLSVGLDKGTTVVTVGVAELYGAETGVSK